MARYSWIGDYNEASTFLSYFASTGLNYGDWKNTEYDKDLDKAMLASSEKERLNYYQDAEQVFANDMPAIPVYFYTTSVLKQQRIGGYSTTNASRNRYTRDLYVMKE